MKKYVWAAVAVLLGVAQLYLLLDTRSGADLYVPVVGTPSTTTITPGSTLKAPWGSVTSDSFKVDEINTCRDFTFDLQVTDLAPIGDPKKFVELKGTSGLLFAVTAAELKVGSNPVTFSLCRRQEDEWRAKVESPWGARDFTIKSYPNCGHFFVDSVVEGDSLQLITSCAAVK